MLLPLCAPGCLERFELGTPAAQDSSESSADAEGEAGSGEATASEQGEQGNEGESESGQPEDCGAACDPLVEICDEGECICRPGFERCAGMCVELDSDPEHCGACSDPCEAMQVCDRGECSDQGCAEEEASACEGACVELDSNPGHCGACGQACLGDELCVGGQCLGYVFADCELDSECGAGVCCELEGEGEGEGESVCVNGEQCP